MVCFWATRAWAVAAVSLTAVLGAWGAADGPQQKKKPDPLAEAAAAQANAAAVAQLNAQFNVWDGNRDSFLDKAELARAFRGPDAKPAGATKDAAGEASKSANPSAEYPDHQFLKQWDKDADDRLSRKEFDGWAKEYAAAMKPVFDAEARLRQAEKKAAQQRTGSRQQRQAEQEARQEREALQKHTQKLKALDRAVQEALRRSKN